MIYPANFEEKLGFDQIRQRLRKKCLSLLGNSRVDKMEFQTDDIVLTRLLKQTHQFKSMLELEPPFPSQDYLDLTLELEELKMAGRIIDIEVLFDLKISLVSIQQVIQYIKQLNQEAYDEIIELAGPITIPEEIRQRIEKTIDNKGEIRDNATAELMRIRKSLIHKQSEIEQKIRKKLATAKRDGITSTDVEPTIRGGRLVIPVLTTHKRKIKGFIHDESSTGQTVYIEPTEVFDINNEIRDLENAEKREVKKILADISDYIRPFIPELLKAYHFIGQIDFIRAKALFAIELGACMPLLSNRQLISWHNARHPLLHLSHKAQKKKVVPLNIELNKDQRILIISGPNAGGKSVCLMTVGLIQYMFQCGLLVPVDLESESGIFEHMFIDIGDEQSLENDLSTYSSHLLNIKNFIMQINQSSIFLIDEFGTGTEPQLGGAIAEAALEELNRKKAFGVVTTHYANLKLVANRHHGIINGAMLFDARKLKPLYEMRTGKPGSSFAFEIAEQIGFPKQVLENAADKTGTTQLDFDKQLQQLEIEKNEILKKKTELRVADDFLSEMIDKYEALNHELESSKQKIVEEAKEKATEIISGSNKLIENTIREIREIQAQKEKTRALRKKIQTHKQRIKEIPSTSTKQHHVKKSQEGEKKMQNDKIKLGDFVTIKNQGMSGEVTQIDKDEALIAFENFNIRASLENLQKVAKKNIKSQRVTPKSSYKNIIDNINQRAAEFKLSLDLRGKRVDEAMAETQKFIDDAILLNISEVSIVHGKGDGILRDAIRELLKSIDQIKGFHDAHPDRGGHGITMVYLS